MQSVLEDFIEKVKELSSWEEKCLALAIEVKGTPKRSYLEGIVRLLDQAHLLPLEEASWQALEALENYYAPLGGLLGYQLEFLKLKESSPISLDLTQPKWFDLRYPTKERQEIVTAGVEALPKLGELYVLGGLATRLKLKDREGNSLPAALLPFKGKTLLEGLIRDVVGREMLYERVYGEKITIPIVMMSSQLLNHFSALEQLCQQLLNRYDRPADSIRLFSQIGVPVLDEQGKWLLKGPGKLFLQPGGHGALWRSAQMEGIFTWFKQKGIEHLLIRQINNPVSSVDDGLCAFTGFGIKEKKALGFASCCRPAGAEEGMLAYVHRPEGTTLSNIEYTDFKKFGLEDRPCEQGNSFFPANTNLIYAHLPELCRKLEQTPFVKSTLNFKQSEEGKRYGRLESMMQSVSDLFIAPNSEEMQVYLTYNERSYTLSSSKRFYEDPTKLLGTPEKAYYDWASTSHDLLVECGFNLPSFPVIESYLKEGLTYTFNYHPALGPFFRHIAQKIQGGEIGVGSLLVCELARLRMSNLTLQGVLHIESPSLRGGVLLDTVQVSNLGGELETPYWKQQWKIKEQLKIVVEGESFFEAHHVKIKGNQSFHVPDGEHWVLTQKGLEKRGVVDARRSKVFS